MEDLFVKDCDNSQFVQNDYEELDRLLYRLNQINDSDILIQHPCETCSSIDDIGVVAADLKGAYYGAKLGWSI